jgi:hypothetical protein
MEKKYNGGYFMEDWGLFASKNELPTMVLRVLAEDFDIFEIRKLTFAEKWTYVRDDIRLFFGDPHVIMFRASEADYRNFVQKYNLISTFYSKD